MPLAAPAASWSTRTLALGLIGALAAAAILKGWLLARGVLPFNADESIVALMARHILDGARPVFFYGQAYMGSLDAWLVAAAFRLFGVEIWSIRLVQIVLYLLTVGTTAWLGRQVFDRWEVGVLAAWFMAVPTVNVTLYTTVSLGNYGEALLLGNLILIVTLLLGESIATPSPTGAGLWSPDGRRRWLVPALWFGWGALAGFGLWVFGLTLVYSLPAGAYLAFHLWRSHPKGEASGLRRVATPAGLIALGFVLGATPWWSFALKSGWGDLLAELSGGAIAGVEGLPWWQQVGQHTFNLLLLGSTAILGMRPPWSVRWLALPLIPFALAFWSATSAFTMDRLRGQTDGYERHLLLIGVMGVLVGGFLLTPFGADPSGRYFLPLMVVMALFAAELLWRLSVRWGSRMLGLGGLILVFHLWGTVQSAAANPPGLTTQFDTVTQVDHSHMPALIDFLEKEGETLGYTNYWVAYPLAFRSAEQLIYVPRLPYHLDFRHTNRDDRYAPYAEQVDSGPQAAYITTNHPALNEALRREFGRLGVSWLEARIGDYQVFYSLSRKVNPGELSLSPRALGSGSTGP